MKVLIISQKELWISYQNPKNKNDRTHINKLMKAKEYKNVAIVDPANDGCVKKFMGKNGCPGMKGASKGIYNLYNLNKDNLPQTEGNNIYKGSSTNKNNFKPTEAIGIKYTDKGWVIHTVGPRGNKVKDYDVHGEMFKAPEEEKEIEILYKNCIQEGWGAGVTFIPKDVVQISFQTVGQPYDSVYLEVYDLEIIPKE